MNINDHLLCRAHPFVFNYDTAFIPASFDCMGRLRIRDGPNDEFREFCDDPILIHNHTWSPNSNRELGLSPGNWYEVFYQIIIGSHSRDFHGYYLMISEREQLNQKFLIESFRESSFFCARGVEAQSVV